MGVSEQPSDAKRACWDFLNFIFIRLKASRGCRDRLMPNGSSLTVKRHDGELLKGRLQDVRF